MSVLMTKKKADAIRSVERDAHLISDKTAAERVISTEPRAVRQELERFANSREYQEFRMKHG